MEIVHGKLIEGVPYETYAAHPGVSASVLKEILRSPQHYYWRKTNPSSETPAKRFGKLLHMAVLEPDEYNRRFVVEPEFIGYTKDGRPSARSGEAQEKKKEWYANLAADVVVVKQDERDRILVMRDRLMSHDLTKNLFAAGGAREATITWIDEETGIECKARPDFVSSTGVCVNLKTTRDARESSFRNDIVKYGYNFSAAHYCAGGRAASAYRPDGYLFVAIESEPPHGIMVYSGEVSVLWTGDHEYRKALKVLEGCLKTGVYPGYPTACKRIEVPEWYENMIQKDASDMMAAPPGFNEEDET